ncbi:sulfate/molybdate ABC transporter ATP-binding protein [Gordonia polyisoprenivorans]|uniref:ABC transporter ATP-binding protein n=2 Tax=Gordonia TaxID=2053 RepID=A0A846WIP4_9ACTN|nr:ABC transporter ATP-binding protein [Gordonia polyisoprenivorans]NKY00763.1 ABC transporter ATP-binding protein [Gordonia polyisoprenivorans]OZC33502.1 ABC transporter ATP-binding protein [Gordonia polyisoprenivorans]
MTGMAMNSLEQQGFRASVRCTVPDLVADIEVAPGDTLGIIGPNGAGKSTLLSIVAGLRRTPDSRVAVGSRILQGDRTFVEPHRRSVVLLEQKARLFGHLSVRRNVEFGPAAAGLSRKDIRNRAQRWLDAVGVADLADRMPSGLSGGQAQRVAIARALATEPEVLLLDEPFAALDVDVAQQMRSLMRHLLADRAGMTVLVTHDLIDVVSLADRIAVIDDARIVQTGPTTSVLTRPESAFTASLAGTNLIVGQLRDAGTVVADDGIRVVGTVVESAAAGRAAAAFSPRAVAVYLRDPQGSPRNSWHGVVEDVIPQGDRALVRTRCGEHRIGAEVTWASVVDLDLSPGTDVVLSVKATEVSVYGAAGSPS